MTSANTLIHTDGRVLAALDVSAYSASVAHLAGWAASRLGAPLELVHAIDRQAGPKAKSDLSGNLSLGGQDDLLAELSALDESRAKLAQESGRRMLEQAKVITVGIYEVPTESRLRHGELVETLLELEPGVRLFVLGMQGEHAALAKGHIGGNLERVARAVHRPVLVASQTFSPPQRFLIAFDGSPTTRRCVEIVCASPLLKGLPCELLTVGDPARPPEGMEWAENQLANAGFKVHARVEPGQPDEVIARNVRDHAVDMVVMGAYGHSKIRQLIVGSTTTQVLRACLVPVLLLR